MKNILIFSTAYLPFLGGAEIAVKEISDRLANTGENAFAFDLITARLDSKLPKQEVIGNVKVHRIGLGGKLDRFLLPFFGLVLALRRHRERKYKIIFSVMASQAGIAAAFFKILKPDLKLIVNLQEGDEEEHLARYVFGNLFLYKIFIRPLARLVIKKADLITVISNYLKERAIAAGAKCPIEIVPNGVDINKFKVKSEKFKVNEFKKELGIDESEKIIITVSRLVKKNGVDDLIRAMLFLADEKCCLLIIGAGEDEGKLKKLAQELQLENKIKFLGKIAHEEVPKYLWVSDVFVRPSLSEGLGNVFLEAMAAGLPVVGTCVGGIPDFLFDPGHNPGKAPTGLFCRARDPESIAASVRRLFYDEELKNKIIANGQALVLAEYDWNIISKNMGGIFFKL